MELLYKAGANPEARDKVRTCRLAGVPCDREWDPLSPGTHMRAHTNAQTCARFAGFVHVFSAANGENTRESVWKVERSDN